MMASSILYILSIFFSYFTFITVADYTSDYMHPNKPVDIGFKEEIYKDIQDKYSVNKKLDDNTVCCKCNKFVNPHDMLNYAHGSQKMEDTQVVDRNKINYYNDANISYLKRFVSLFLRTVGLKDQVLRSGERRRVQFDFIINHKELNVLQSFSENGDVELIELNEAFSRIFDPSHHTKSGEEDYVHYFKAVGNNLIRLPRESPEVCIAICVVAVFSVTAWQVVQMKSFTRSLVSLVFIIFACGFGWNWFRMVKEEEARLDALRHLNSKELPLHCRPQDMTWYQYMWNSFTYEKDCEKYFQKMSIDPIVKISPTIVLVETVSTCVLYPADKIGTAFGLFIRGLLESIPLAYKWYVVPLVLLLISGLFFMIIATWFGMGLKLKLPFSCLEIGYFSPKRRFEERQFIEMDPKHQSIDCKGGEEEVKEKTKKDKKKKNSPRAIKESSETMNCSDGECSSEGSSSGGRVERRRKKEGSEVHLHVHLPVTGSPSKGAPVPSPGNKRKSICILKEEEESS